METVECYKFRGRWKVGEDYLSPSTVVLPAFRASVPKDERDPTRSSSCLPTLTAVEPKSESTKTRFEAGSKARWCGGGWAPADARHGRRESFER